MDYAAEARAEAEEDDTQGAAAASAPRGAYKPRVPASTTTLEPADPEARRRNAQGDLVFEDAPVRIQPRLPRCDASATTPARPPALSP